MDKRNTVMEDEAVSLDEDIQEARELERQLEEQRAERDKAIKLQEMKDMGFVPDVPEQSQVDKVNDPEANASDSQAESQTQEPKKGAEQNANASDSTEPSTVDDRLDLLEKQFGMAQELHTAELQDRDITINGLKRKLDQRAGEIGHLRQQVTGRNLESRDLLAESAEEYNSQPGHKEPASRNGMSATDMYAFKSARADLLNGFTDKHQEVVVKDKDGIEQYDENFQVLVKEFEKDYENEIISGDFDKYQEAIQDILNGAYRRWDLSNKRAEMENARNRRTAVAEQNQRAGLATAISNSSGAGAGSQSNKAKSLDDMTLEELEALANSDPNRTHIPKTF